MAPQRDIDEIKHSLQEQGKAIFQIHVALLGDMSDPQARPGVITRMDRCENDRSKIWRAIKYIGSVISILAYKLVTGDWIPFNG